MENGISVVILAYKEAENLKILLPQIRENMEKIGEAYEILIIDTAVPTDNTKDICGENHAVYIPQEKPFYGGAFQTGIKYAKYNKLQTLDADGSHNPSTLPEIYKQYQAGYDIVIGSRYTKGGVTHDAKISIIMSHILNCVMRICIGVKAKDISTAYRLYNTELLKKVNLQGENYDVLQEVILKMKLIKKKNSKEKFRIGEVPIVFEKRMFGESKRNLGKFILSYIKTLFILIKLQLVKEEV